MTEPGRPAPPALRGTREVALRAGLHFAVLAVVVLPLLPEGPCFGPLALRPRSLWLVVLAFCALNFATYFVRRLVGARHGYGIAGALGGMLSSTAVALSYARRSRLAGEDSGALARGVIAACAVLVPRILVISAALAPPVSLAAAPYLLPALAAAFILVFVVADGSAGVDGESSADERSPLRFMSALQLALAFQVAISAIGMLKNALGAAGVYGAAVVLGLTDMDALTVSMSRSSTIAADIAGRALGIGMLANTTFKLSLALVMGSPTFRRRASHGLGLLGALTFAALLAL